MAMATLTILILKILTENLSRMLVAAFRKPPETL
jgi:hypothetical protein